MTTPAPPNQPRRTFGERLIIAIPYAWLVCFFLVPFVIVARISLSQTAIAQPPYTPVLDPAQGLEGVVSFVSALSLDTYRLLASDSLYLVSYLSSVWTATLATAILLVIGLPIAWGMARTSERTQAVLVLLVMLPFWTSFLIRIYAWVNILQRDGLLNGVLLATGIVDAPVVWLSTDTAVMIGLVYTYLPFMVLPLYASLAKFDESLIEAAADLGCPRGRAFFLVVVPAIVPGIVAATLLCFIPIVGEFVVPDLLGGSDTTMIGRTLWTEFFSNRDWPVAAALAVMLLALLVVPIAVFETVREHEEERR